MNNTKNYYLFADDTLVSVTKEIYDCYHRSKNREKYLERMDRKNGLIFYNEWDNESHLGVDLVTDSSQDTEKTVLQGIDAAILWKCVNSIKDECNICFLISQGYSERDISKITGLSQAAINKKKKKIFVELVKLLKNANF